MYSYWHGKGQGGWWARSGLHGHCPHPDPPQNASDPPPVELPLLAHPWGCGEQLGPSGAGPGPRPRSQDPAPHQEAACGAGHSAEPLEAAPAVSLCGPSHTGLRATRAAIDTGRPFLGPVPRSQEPQGGSDAMPEGPLGSPSIWSQRAGESQGTVLGVHSCLTHTFCCLLFVSDSHTAGASRSGCSHDHPQPPDTRTFLPVPKAASRTLSALPSCPLGTSAGASCPLSCIAAPSQAPSPSHSFIHSANTH